MLHRSISRIASLSLLAAGASLLASCLAAAPDEEDLLLAGDAEESTAAISAAGSYPVYGIHFYGAGAENTIRTGRGCGPWR